MIVVRILNRHGKIAEDPNIDHSLFFLFSCYVYKIPQYLIHSLIVHLTRHLVDITIITQGHHNIDTREKGAAGGAVTPHYKPAPSHNQSPTPNNTAHMGETLSIGVHLFNHSNRF